MQKQRRKFCPLCREDVVLQADEGKSLLFSLSLFPRNLKGDGVFFAYISEDIETRIDMNTANWDSR
jgi:hypothetical protein